VAIGEPPLPDDDLAPRRLFVRPDPASAAGIAATTLSQFDFAQAISYSLLAWRRLLSSQGRSWLTDQLESQFQNIRFRGIVTQQLRSALGDSAPGVRSRALQLLGEGLGDLQDVGLLLDLSELPPQELSEAERAETLNAIKEITGAALEL
jgi:hypothetical protein